MTYVYPQLNAYDVIQHDVENNFHSLINKTKDQIKNIVIVGAYHGYEINRLLSNYPNCTITAFEAVPQHFNVLSSLYSRNSRVKLINKVVSNFSGEVKFYELGNGGEGSGSILKFQGDEHGHPFKISKILNLPSTTLKQELKGLFIDLLWIDVQGAELEVLKGTDLSKCSSIFSEIHTHDFIQPWDKEPYKGQCFKEDLENYLVDFNLHSIGLDNQSGNGQGNSFWVNKNL